MARPDQPDLDRDPVIEAYKAGIDRTLIRERLARTPAERADDLVALVRFAEELRQAGVAGRHQLKAIAGELDRSDNRGGS